MKEGGLGLSEESEESEGLELSGRIGVIGGIGRIGIIGAIGRIGGIGIASGSLIILRIRMIPIILIIPIIPIVVDGWIVLMVAIIATCGAHCFADAAVFQKTALLGGKHLVEEVFGLDYHGDGKVAEFFRR